MESQARAPLGPAPLHSVEGVPPSVRPCLRYSETKKSMKTVQSLESPWILLDFNHNYCSVAQILLKLVWSLDITYDQDCLS